MKISIVIPVYNVEDYLRECIDSVLQQSYKNIEIILVNDNSTDSSEQICYDYAKRHENIRLINNSTNEGPSGARNIGIREASGEYLLFLDADDLYSCDFLADVIKEINETKEVDFIFFRYKCYYQLNDIYKEPQIRISKDEIDGKNGVESLKTILQKNKGFKWYSFIYVVRRNFLIKNNLFFAKVRCYEDILWTPKLFLNAEQVIFFDKPIYIYRMQREGQLTSKYNTLNNLRDSIYAAVFWHNKLQKKEIDQTLKKLLLKNVADNYFVSIWYSGFLNRKERNELFYLLKKNSHLLNFQNGLLSKLTAIICKTMGYRFCSLLFKNLIDMKRGIVN